MIISGSSAFCITMSLIFDMHDLNGEAEAANRSIVSFTTIHAWLYSHKYVLRIGALNLIFMLVEHVHFINPLIQSIFLSQTLVQLSRLMI